MRVSSAMLQIGELAQLGERLVCNQKVTGSNPVFSTEIEIISFVVLFHKGDNEYKWFFDNHRNKVALNCYSLGNQSSAIEQRIFIKLLRAHGGCLGTRRR